MSTSLETAAFYSARPSLKLDGQVEADLADSLISMIVEETRDGLYRCEATFGNWGTKDGEVGFLFLDRQKLDFGKPLEITAGDSAAEQKIFIGRITGLEAMYPQQRGPELTVLAEDRFQDLRMTRRTRTFADASDEDVIRQIASEYSMQTDIDLSGPTYRVISQVNQSDLALLRQRVRAIDAELWIEGDRLFAHSRAGRNQGELTLQYGQNLQEFSALADAANQRTSLTVSGWDVAAKEAIEFTAEQSAIQSELGGQTSGASVLQEAIGGREERIVHLLPESQAEAQSLAESRFRSMARQFVTGCGTADGDGRIRVGARITLEGLGGLFSGEYYVTEARHLFDARKGLRTRFCVERPGIEE